MTVEPVAAFSRERQSLARVAPVESEVTSPCTGVCAYDETTGWCFGCGRTQAEIGGWRAAPKAERAAVWPALAARLTRLGVTVRRPLLSPAALRRRLRDTLSKPGGCWVVGLHGALAEVPTPTCTVGGTVTTVVAHGLGGALWFHLSEHARRLESYGPDGRMTVLILAAQQLRLKEDVATGRSEIGRDAAAHDPSARGDVLFDLGLGLTARPSRRWRLSSMSTRRSGRPTRR